MNSIRLLELKEDYSDGPKVNWSKVFAKDPDMLGSILAGVARSGTRRKKSMDIESGNRKYAALSQTDYSELPFKDAVDVLARRRPLEGVDVNLDDPTLDNIIEVAAYFSKHPAYFMEYRIRYVLSSVYEFLSSHPETAVAWFNKAYGSRGLSVK